MAIPFHAMGVLVSTLLCVIADLAIRILGYVQNVWSNRSADKESSTPDQPFRFLDLPPEIRNMIYVGLLDEGDDQVEHPGNTSRHFWLPKSVKIQLQGLYNPYTWWIEHCGQIPAPADKRLASGVLLHCDTPMTMTCRQIRHEARSLYLRDHLSLEMRGRHEDEPYWDSKERLRGLRLWMSTLSSLELDSIRHLEIRQYVQVVHPSVWAFEKGQRVHPEDRTRGELGDWAQIQLEWFVGHMAALQLHIYGGGKVLEVPSRLQLIARHADEVKAKVDELARAKARAGAVFTGRDLLELMQWLETFRHVPYFGLAVCSGKDLNHVRWRMLGALDEVEYVKATEEYGPRLLVKRGFRHMVARASINDMDEIL